MFSRLQTACMNAGGNIICVFLGGVIGYNVADIKLNHPAIREARLDAKSEGYKLGYRDAMNGRANVSK
jgi:hypothetical protein